MRRRGSTRPPSRRSIRDGHLMPRLIAWCSAAERHLPLSGVRTPGARSSPEQRRESHHHRARSAGHRRAPPPLNGRRTIVAADKGRAALVAFDVLATFGFLSLMRDGGAGPVAAWMSWQADAGLLVTAFLTILLLGATRAYDPVSRLPGSRLRHLRPACAPRLVRGGHDSARLEGLCRHPRCRSARDRLSRLDAPHGSRPARSSPSRNAVIPRGRWSWGQVRLRATCGSSPCATASARSRSSAFSTMSPWSFRRARRPRSVNSPSCHASSQSTESNS